MSTSAWFYLIVGVVLGGTVLVCLYVLWRGPHRGMCPCFDWCARSRGDKRQPKRRQDPYADQKHDLQPGSPVYLTDLRYHEAAAAAAARSSASSMSASDSSSKSLIKRSPASPQHIRHTSRSLTTSPAATRPLTAPSSPGEASPRACAPYRSSPHSYTPPPLPRASTSLAGMQPFPPHFRSVSQPAMPMQQPYDPYYHYPPHGYYAAGTPPLAPAPAGPLPPIPHPFGSFGHTPVYAATARPALAAIQPLRSATLSDRSLPRSTDLPPLPALVPPALAPSPTRAWEQQAYPSQSRKSVHAV